jgi:diaminopimelate epimerase
MQLTGLHFSKYHGTGNDFIILNENAIGSEHLSTEMISKMCHRHFGIGADGLIIIAPSANADFEMKYYNSDGYPGTMCGNGGRCAVAYALHHQILQNSQSAAFFALGKVYQAQIKNSTQISCIIELNMQDTSLPVPGIENGYLIDTGSPHLVLLKDNISDLDVYSLGKKIRYDNRLIPGGANINFIAPDKEGIFVRTYERGVENETLSCGTGVTASAIVWAFLQQQTGLSAVNTKTRGGDLNVGFRMTGSKVTDITLTGPAVRVFDGIFTDALLNTKIYQL